MSQRGNQAIGCYRLLMPPNNHDNPTTQGMAAPAKPLGRCSSLKSWSPISKGDESEASIYTLLGRSPTDL
ncbi:hypothetical protein PBY51_002929 [Eleginops maclovinus]|uniref:Uncharacterized protein n=1 Tax=Eleginops maclovinus TaxID=56733 RepID=A0AAN7XEM8_ELEMC|nr:hypothetical protein PBY51_002929 [Eleginops maclovinus]